MRLFYLVILITMFTLPACALDTGIAPSERAAAAAAAQGDAGLGEGEDSNEGGSEAEALLGPLGGTLSGSQGAWPATYTTTLSGGGLTLQPLGAQRGVSGTLSASDGSLNLEALP